MAGSLNKQNIIIGAATIYLGPSWDGVTGSNPIPTPVANNPYRTTVDAAAGWTNVGYTQEGFEISYEPDYGDVEVDQVLDSVKLFQQSMRVNLNTTIAEATLFNLMVVWGQQSSTLSSSASDAVLDIAPGELGDSPVERGLLAIGNGTSKSTTDNNYNERTYHAYRVLSVDTTAHALRRNENTALPVSFRALPSNTGKYGTVRDRVRTW